MRRDTQWHKHTRHRIRASLIRKVSDLVDGMIEVCKVNPPKNRKGVDYEQIVSSSQNTPIDERSKHQKLHVHKFMTPRDG
ncbi:hypothetical protein PENTCL1PPCAC_14436 [Pristionchus entomophagus]|uniref:Uncharacterized protein n=1 Tax=Pristionchus entomophagus TaxID=358040 RepID=A0AAV5T9K7_9BILA|nr:hypothetical protein PENTCL1PPCAC_14436 [Pristionchus entomophagus]